jgi:monoamine oxidase
VRLKPCSLLDFNSLRVYNGANLRCHQNRFGGRRHLKIQRHELDRRKGNAGGPVDQRLKELMKELGEAINESLSDSEQIAEVVSRIKEGGYDIFLVLEATIGVSKQGDKTPDKTSLVTTLSTNPEFKVNDQDLKFLKSLRIKIEEK